MENILLILFLIAIILFGYVLIGKDQTPYVEWDAVKDKIINNKNKSQK